MSIKSLLLIAVALCSLAGVIYIAATEQSSTSAAPKISWQFTDRGYDESRYADRTAVSLVVDGTVYDVGTYNGSCWTLGTDTAPLLPRETAGIQCWFAGAGDEVGIFSEGGSFVVRHGELQEPQGDDTADFRGNFRTLFELPR